MRNEPNRRQENDHKAKRRHGNDGSFTGQVSQASCAACAKSAPAPPKAALPSEARHLRPDGNSIAQSGSKSTDWLTAPKRITASGYRADTEGVSLRRPIWHFSSSFPAFYETSRIVLPRPPSDFQHPNNQRPSVGATRFPLPTGQKTHTKTGMLATRLLFPAAVPVKSPATG